MTSTLLAGPMTRTEHRLLATIACLPLGTLTIALTLVLPGALR